jgi:site-specific recombinase XerC
VSIRQRAWTGKRGHRSAWVVNYTDAKGKRRLKHFKTKKAAADWDAATRNELKHGVHVADADSITVEQAGRLWLATVGEAGLERSTREHYRRHVELHMMPLIGTMRLNQLTVPAVRAFHDRMRAAGRSAELARKVMVSLGSMLADAQERGLTARNPVRERRRRRSPSERHKEKLAVGVHIPAPAEVRAILNAATGRWRPFVGVGALAGLRISEIRGLPWRDVDLAARTVTVRQRADAWSALGSPKAAASRRTIPVPLLVINALKEWKLACPSGDANKLGLVFPSGAGGVVTHGDGEMRATWHALQVAAGVAVPDVDEAGKPLTDDDGAPIMRAKYPGFHALRHFFASWCAARPQDGGLGLPLKTVQVRMGHSTLAMTADTYGHLFPSQDDAEVLAAGERALMGV